MSRVIFWRNGKIVKETIFRRDECRYKCNGICYNNNSKQLGRKCYKCKDFVEEKK